MLVEIRGRDLPGRLFCEHTNVHVGVQRRGTRAEGRGLLTTETWAGDSPRARWEFAVTVAEDGDIRGPHVQGRRGDRFVYLSWVDVASDGVATMFRRAKLMLGAVPPEVLTAAGRSGWRLVGDVGLTDSRGEPAVRRGAPTGHRLVGGLARVKPVRPTRSGGAERVR